MTAVIAQDHKHPCGCDSYSCEVLIHENVGGDRVWQQKTTSCTATTQRTFAPEHDAKLKFPARCRKCRRPPGAQSPLRHGDREGRVRGGRRRGLPLGRRTQARRITVLGALPPSGINGNAPYGALTGHLSRAQKRYLRGLLLAGTVGRAPGEGSRLPDTPWEAGTMYARRPVRGALHSYAC